MAKYIISAFADEYSRDVETQIGMLCENGISHIEPRFIGKRNISELSRNDASELAKKLDNAKIAVSSIGSPLGKITLDDDFDAHLETARRVFDTAKLLGAKNVRVFSFYGHSGTPVADSRAEVIEKLGRMIELAERFGVLLCHENEGAIYGESPDACLDLLDAFDGRLRCVFDMGNFTLGGYDSLCAYEKLCGYIEYFHIKDAIGRDAIVPPGCGEAKIAEILERHIRTADRDIFVTLEPHLETFDGLNRLTDRKFDNPYKFESKEAAFLCAIQKLRGLSPKNGLFFGQ